jgi:hypothetical protein
VSLRRVVEPKPRGWRRPPSSSFRAWVESQSTLTLTVRGIQAGGYDISHCLDGDPVELVPEPNNEFDRNAIRVDAVTGETLGYLPADYAAVMESREWSASILVVVLHPVTGAPAGLRLALKRRVETTAKGMVRWPTRT